MRIAILTLVSLMSLAMVPVAAAVFPSLESRTGGASNPYFVEIAQGCGAGFHWVGNHRNRYGAWVPGRCVRN